ncbi:MAG: mechanosensitive ion channel family protein [Bacteroidales bacterium]|jgi:miniconductance mechanosensitive channel|nr:mechanosensitive ion channel family protein [Bacteroidales bacterium]
MEQLSQLIHRLLSNQTMLGEASIANATTVIIIIALILACVIGYWITNRFVVDIVERMVKSTKNQYDDFLLEKKVFNKLAQITPALIINLTLPTIIEDAPKLGRFLSDIAQVWIIIVVLLTLSAFLNVLNDIYLHSKISKNRSIKGYIQLVKVIAANFGTFAILAVFIEDFHMSKVFASIGAMAAVLILVFRDTILSLVASIQIGANDMVRLGDWISLPKYGADGEVIEITLNTIKIQNWDKTISTVPVYALVSDSFQNWRGMSDSGGRRIKRSLNIDMKSVTFASPELLEKLGKFYLLQDYIGQKETELKERNAKLNLGENIVANGARQTNLGIFRKYLEAYLHSLPTIHNDMTFLIRHLQPSEKGIPIEIYVFSNQQEWAAYENIQADIFDHVLAIISEFELRLFQNPTGDDLKFLKNT